MSCIFLWGDRLWPTVARDDTTCTQFLLSKPHTRNIHCRGMSYALLFGSAHARCHPFCLTYHLNASSLCNSTLPSPVDKHRWRLTSSSLGGQDLSRLDSPSASGLSCALLSTSVARPRLMRSAGDIPSSGRRSRGRGRPLAEVLGMRASLGDFTSALRSWRCYLCCYSHSRSGSAASTSSW